MSTFVNIYCSHMTFPICSRVSGGWWRKPINDATRNVCSLELLCATHLGVRELLEVWALRFWWCYDDVRCIGFRHSKGACKPYFCCVFSELDDVSMTLFFCPSNISNSAMVRWNLYRKGRCRKPRSRTGPWCCHHRLLSLPFARNPRWGTEKEKKGMERMETRNNRMPNGG